jgi:hypothetical protein
VGFCAGASACGAPSACAECEGAASKQVELVHVQRPEGCASTAAAAAAASAPAGKEGRRWNSGCLGRMGVCGEGCQWGLAEVASLERAV